MSFQVHRNDGSTTYKSQIDTLASTIEVDALDVAGGTMSGDITVDNPLLNLVSSTTTGAFYE